MAAKWMLARSGLGFSPGSPKYIVTRGLVPTGAVVDTGDEGSFLLMGVGRAFLLGAVGAAARAAVLLLVLLAGCATGGAPASEIRTVPLPICDARMIDANVRGCAMRGLPYEEPTPEAPCGQCVR